MLSRLVAVCILVISLVQAAYCQEDLLNFLIEQNEAAREKIATAKYKVRWTTDVEVQQGLRHNEGTGEVAIKGDLRLSTQECDASIPAADWEYKFTMRMVINDKYLAYWPTFGNPNIYQDDHQSLKELSDDAKARLLLHTTPDTACLDFAFGGEEGTDFREQMGLHPGKITWTAEEQEQADGDSLYVIKRYMPFMNDPAKPEAVWTIDPDKGFLVTEAVFYRRTGDVWVTRRTEAAEVADGIWFPVSYEEYRYKESADLRTGEEPDSHCTIKLEDVSINEAISDDYFVIESILPEEYRESTKLFRKGLDGNTEVYTYWNGGYVLRDYVATIEHEIAKTLKGGKDKPVAEQDKSARGSPSQVTKNGQASSVERQISLVANDDEKRPAYIVFGLSGVALLAFISVLTMQLLKKKVLNKHNKPIVSDNEGGKQ